MFSLSTRHNYKQGTHWSKQTKPQNNGKGMYVGFKQLRGGREHCVTPAWVAAKDTFMKEQVQQTKKSFKSKFSLFCLNFTTGNYSEALFFVK